MAPVIARQRLAQFGNAALPGVEGLAGSKAAHRGACDELRRRQVALACPERDQAGAAAAVVHDGFDAAGRRETRFGAQTVYRAACFGTCVSIEGRSGQCSDPGARASKKYPGGARQPGYIRRSSACVRLLLGQQIADFGQQSDIRRRRRWPDAASSRLQCACACCSPP